jgi:hypothetical protein
LILLALHLKIITLPTIHHSKQVPEDAGRKPHHVRYKSNTDSEITLKIVDTRTTVETNPGLASNSMAINVELMAVGMELSRINTLRSRPSTPIKEVRAMATRGESTRRNTVESAIGLYVFCICVCDN